MKEVSTKDLNHTSRGTRIAQWIPTLRSFGFLFLFFVANPQCRKSVPSPNILPAVTQEGKNTFGCKVNGEVWIPYYQCGLINIFSKCEELESVVTNVDTTSKLPVDVKISASRRTSSGGSFTGFIMGTRITKAVNVGSYFSITFVRDSVSYNPQYPINNASNAINITKIDTVNQIISGTFNFTLYGPYGPSNGDSVVVTDGRFDLTFNACHCH
jgi:hypothetical protein